MHSLHDSWLWRMNNLSSCWEKLLFLCPTTSTISVCKTFSPVNPAFQSQASFFIVKIALSLVLCNYLHIKIEANGENSSSLLLRKTSVEQ